MANFKTVIKIVGKFVGPVVAGVMTVASEIENHKLKETVAELVTKVSKLEQK